MSGLSKVVGGGPTLAESLRAKKEAEMRRCLVCRDVPKDLLREIDEAFVMGAATRDWGPTQIARELNARGYDISRDTLTRHRNLCGKAGKK